jgi:FolB domain-containing protein
MNDSGDILRIRDLLVRCIVGLKPEERNKRQDILVNVTLAADLGKACRSDRLRDSVDYRAIKHKILGAAETTRFYLIERLAQHIADLCLEDPKVRQATVSVQKPGALRFARCAEVEISRSRRAGIRGPRQRRG